MLRIFIFSIILACSSTTKDIKIISLNVKNYISKSKGSFEKSLKERHSLSKFLAEQQADILVLSELEEPKGRENLQKLLIHYNQTYPFVYTTNSFTKRDLVIFSKIKAKNVISEHKIPYTIKGKKEYVSRGFLAVEFSPRANYDFTIVLVHLKSKRVHPLGSNNIRYEEIKQLLSFLKRLEKPKDNLIICGDFNDNYNSKIIKLMKKHYDPLKFTDQRGELWTYFYQYQQIYSRFDYIFANKNIKKEISQSKIIDRDYKNISDHRALSLLISPFDRK